MIAIHNQSREVFFSRRWKQYCDEKKIEYKLVSCYDNDIIDQLQECEALLWHVNNLNHKDQLLAKNLVNAIENTGIKIFPNRETLWHFDDKVAQKYLLESVGAPLVRTYVFYKRSDALKWIKDTNFPKVFKLRKGGGAVNVALVKNKRHARRLVKKAYGKGFSVLNMKSIYYDQSRRFFNGNITFVDLLKAIVRLLIPTDFVRMSAREKGYIYFQDFLAGNTFDQRIIVVGDKAITGKRMNRKNDFRASGSGTVDLSRDAIDINCVRIAFETSQRLGLQSAAYDFIYNKNGQPRIVEVSFCADPTRKYYKDLKGYWDSELKWHEADEIYFEDWIIENILKED